MTFEDFWSNWPLRKQAKQAAIKAWGKLKQAERDLAAERAKAWCEDWKEQHPKTSDIHPSTYLNQRRFMDMDEIQGQKRADIAEVREMRAQAIRTGRAYLLSMVSAAEIRAMIGDGIVTQAECRDAGLVW